MKLPKTIFYRLYLLIVVTGLCLVAANSLGQSFQLMRYDEDYYYLKDSTRSFYNRIKFIPLSHKKKIYMSFGGEARQEFAAFDNEDWGAHSTDEDNFLLQRYDLHLDIHLGDIVRIFGQIRSALEEGRKTGPRPIDEDELNIQNLFIDITPLRRTHDTLLFRIGRQEIDYGSERLISVREGPNVRIYFDGAKVRYTWRNLSIDGFAMMGENVNPGVFDNTFTKQLNLWGVYSTLLKLKAGNIDLYYLGIYRDSVIYEEGVGNELRHTIGSRFWNTISGFSYNIEGAYQAGKFDNGKISAWTASFDLGYTFNNTLFKPSINVRNDYISGDKRAGDGSLQTFNPLYPQGGYFGFDPQIGPVNLIDIHPYYIMNFFNRVTLKVEGVFNWRYSLQDGVYRPSGAYFLAGASSDKRYIGTSFLISAAYAINRFITLSSGVQYFKTGVFLDEVIPTHKDALFWDTRLGIMF